MTAVTTVGTSADELLLKAAQEIERFLSEIRRLNTEEDGWRTLYREKCHALSERLSNLQQRLEDRVLHARVSLDDLRSALSKHQAEISDGASAHSLRDFQVTLGQRYDELVETLRSRRLPIPAELETEAAHDRTPKLMRAVFHVFMGITCAALYQFVVDKPMALLLLGAFVVFFGAVEILRRFSKPINDFWTDRIFGSVGRPQERYRTNSASYYMWGMALVTLFAPKTIVCAALLVLALGDPIASAVGYRINLLRFGSGKSLGGTLAFILASGTAVALYLAFFSGMSTPVWLGLATVMAVTGALAELFSGKLDDNLVIPVACAGAGMLFTYAVL